MEAELKKYNRDINGENIITNTDKCILIIPTILIIGIFIYDLYLINSLFYIKT
jgi:hypothetical protein